MASRSGRKDMFGVTRYQWPSSMPARAVPPSIAAAPNASIAPPDPPKAGPIAAAAATKVASPAATVAAATTLRATSVPTPANSVSTASRMVNATIQWAKLATALAARDLVAVEEALAGTSVGAAEHELPLRFPALRGGRELLTSASAGLRGG